MKFRRFGGMSRKSIFALFICFSVLLLIGCTSKAESISVSPAPLPERGAAYRIAVASDLHLDPDNTKKGPEATAVQYNPELVDALLWDAKQQDAAFILLTGDLVNGGKYARHAAMTQALRRAEEDGLDVYVVPGNHDLAPTTQSEFAEFYQEFGYGEAYSRDSASLSYCVIRDGLMLLMMDTAGYSVGAMDLPEAPARRDSSPFLSDRTLQWAEDMLRTAEEKELRVLCAGHYNLLPEISREKGSGYDIENRERFLALLKSYSVPLYLSGHMHLRAVYREDGLTELLTEYLLSYPTGYSILDLTDSGVQYYPRRVDVDAWAKQSGQTDRKLLDFARWQQKELQNYARENIMYMSERNPLSKKEAEQAEQFFYAAMDAYWAGSLFDKREELESMPGYEPFFRCAEGYAYGWWLKELIETASPELAGFSLTF